MEMPETGARMSKGQKGNDMKEEVCNKLILAVLQGDDYDDVVRELNQNGIQVTMLNSTGGFLKKRSATIMIGVNEQRVDEVLAILKKRAGQRTETVYQTPFPVGQNGVPTILASVPMQVRCGGIVVFVLDMQKMEKY